MKNKTKAEIFEKTQRNIANKEDLQIISSVYDAIHCLNADIARSVITEPCKLEGLLTNDTKHEIVCFYALHALMAPLCAENVDYTDILNNMNDQDIIVLKQMIETAQKRTQPVRADINKILKEREVKKHSSVINDAMIQSLKIYLEVEDVWQDLNDELVRLLNSINTFEHSTKAPEKNITEPSVDKDKKQYTYWTIEELMAKMGYKHRHNFNYAKKQMLKKHKRKADKIRSWFFYAGQGTGKKQLLFKSEHFKELEKLLNDNTVIKVAKQPEVKNDEIVVKKPTDLVEIKSLETFLNVLQQSCEAAKAEWEAEEIAYKQIAGEALATEDLDKRTELIGKISNANNNIKDSKKKYESLVAQFQEAQNLLQERDSAEKALRETNKKITDFLSQNNIIRE